MKISKKLFTRRGSQKAASFFAIGQTLFSDEFSTIFFSVRQHVLLQLGAASALLLQAVQGKGRLA
jgi:hypothetical protein